MSKLGGYAGKVLRIDLSKHKISSIGRNIIPYSM
jgi:hypothetical protein